MIQCQNLAMEDLGEHNLILKRWRNMNLSIKVIIGGLSLQAIFFLVPILVDEMLLGDYCLKVIAWSQFYLINILIVMLYTVIYYR